MSLFRFEFDPSPHHHHLSAPGPFPTSILGLCRTMQRTCNKALVFQRRKNFALLCNIFVIGGIASLNRDAGFARVSTFVTPSFFQTWTNTIFFNTKQEERQSRQTQADVTSVMQPRVWTFSPVPPPPPPFVSQIFSRVLVPDLQTIFRSKTEAPLVRSWIRPKPQNSRVREFVEGFWEENDKDVSVRVHSEHPSAHTHTHTHTYTRTRLISILMRAAC